LQKNNTRSEIVVFLPKFVAFLTTALSYFSRPSFQHEGLYEAPRQTPGEI
jgi:hypothetical protein